MTIETLYETDDDQPVGFVERVAFTALIEWLGKGLRGQLPKADQLIYEYMRDRVEGGTSGIYLNTESGFVFYAGENSGEAVMLDYGDAGGPNSAVRVGAAVIHTSTPGDGTEGELPELLDDCRPGQMYDDTDDRGAQTWEGDSRYLLDIAQEIQLELPPPWRDWADQCHQANPRD